MNDTEARERFERLIWPHLPSVLRTALILTHNQAEAEDLAQETMLKAFRGIAGFRDGTDARAWLMTILRNTRIDRLRSAGRFEAMSLDQVGDIKDGSDEPDGAWQEPQDILERLADQDLIEALQDLPEEIRWALLLVDVEGMGHQDAARLLDVPVGTIKSRAHRGRAMLRQALARSAASALTGGRRYGSAGSAGECTGGTVH